MIDLSTSYLGLNLATPLVASASVNDGGAGRFRLKPQQMPG